MKKIFSIAVVLMMCLSLAFVGCAKKDKNEINVYMPDGAPALAMAKLMHDENKFNKNIKYQVVTSAEIGGYVANKNAEIILLPINLASKLAQDDYKLISINTLGNLFILGKNSATDVNSLKGKKLGVVNLKQVPGLTLKSILKDNNIPYTETEAELNSINVYLKDIEANPAIISGEINQKTLDYVLCPEPAATNITNKFKDIKIVLSVQEMYGVNSYPQAALLFKNEILKDKKFVESFLIELEENVEWIKVNIPEAVNAVNSHLKEGMIATLNVKSLSLQSIVNCNIKVLRAKDAKDLVKNYINKIIEINKDSAKVVTESFFF